MENRFFVWEYDPGTRYCSLTHLNGLKSVIDIQQGIPYSGRFPSDAHFEMNRKYPRRDILADCLGNADRLVVISRRVKDFMDTLDLPYVRFLPVSIVSHKGTTVGPSYYIIHPTWMIDCIDKTQSQLTWDATNPEWIQDCTKLVINPSKIPGNAHLFRLKHLPSAVVVRFDLAYEIGRQGFSGIDFQRIEQFTRSSFDKNSVG